MPGKVNPVIPEAVWQAAMAVMANDQAIAQACSLGSLELNAFLPLVADALLGSLDLLRNACSIFRRLLRGGLEADEARCRRHVDGATAVLTALVERIGYETATEVARAARENGKSVREIVIEGGLVSGPEFDQLISPERVMRLGHPLREKH